MFGRQAILSVLMLAVGGCGVGAADDMNPSLSNSESDVTLPTTVNGNTLTAAEAKWIAFIKSDVLSRLPGSESQKLDMAAQSAWWTLKEGTLGYAKPNPHNYNLCNSSSGDHIIGPLSLCGSGHAWQVAIAAVQVPNFALSEVETTAAERYPELTLTETLAYAAKLSGYAAGTSTYNSIVNSTGTLRKRWLLAAPAVGITLVNVGVVSGCINGTTSWCYGSRWPETARYAPSREAAFRSIADLRAYFAATPCGKHAEACCAGDTCSDASLVCVSSVCKARQVATTANSVEAKLLAAYPSLFGNRLLVNASVVLTVDEVRSYAGSNRYETLKKALLGESIVAPSGNAPRSDSGAVYVRTGTPEDVLMTQYPCLFGCARAVVRNATAVGIVVGGRQYTGADRYQTLALALRAEGVL